MIVSDLPVSEILPALLEVLDQRNTAVLVAPPGAGKTTAVPLALLDAPWATGKILVLEPRRLATRAAAERMAALMGEPVGATIGYRIRGQSKVSRGTRVEVITEGILTRMIQSDAEMQGISAILFDEIHERSLHSDLGLALGLEIQSALRPDLRLLAMSATLDTMKVAGAMGGAPVITSEGRLFPVETHWRDTPWRRPGDKRARLEAAVSDTVIDALSVHPGDALVFLPGAGEIRRTAALLTPRLPDIDILPLYGAMPFDAQRRALTLGSRRRVVLSTAIAETSLTVEGVTIVVDAGRARRARQNPATGMSRLVTEPVSRAEADQRRGRAGRTAPGVCYRLWTKGEDGALPAFAPPEITVADLTPLALELAQWGVSDPATLAFLDQPPEGALTEARALLSALGALEGTQITAHGRRLAARPMHPRLGHMIERAEALDLAPEAALIAALMGDRDPLRAGPRSADLTLRLRAVLEPKRLSDETPFSADRDTAKRIATEARRLHPAKARVERAVGEAGTLLALAYPDRVGLRRPGDAPRYLLSGGRGALLADDDPMATHRLIVAAELEDTGREATIRLAAPLAEAALRGAYPDRITWTHSAEWSRRHRRVEARSREMFGALALADQHWRDADPEALARALTEGICDLGLSALTWSKSALLLRKRVAWLREAGDQSVPDWSDAALTETLETWLTPHLGTRRSVAEAVDLPLTDILAATLDWETRQRIDQAAPPAFTTPLGSRIAIDYDASAPTIRVRVQEMFGVTAHPSAAGHPLLIELLSPAGRPVQTTRDLPRFWSGSYRDVVKDMRARYPKHPWPDDPAEAAPTRRVKPRG